MNAYPMIRKPGSNETVMSNLFKVTLLYLIPGWISKPENILQFLLILAAALFIDTVFNFIRFRKPVCSVSAAVTASLLHILTHSVPVWGQVAGVVTALTFGKHLWGGTGKNLFNPAILGVFFLTFFFRIEFPVFDNSFWIIAAMFLSLLFLRSRPFASVGWMAGVISALLSKGNFTIDTMTEYGIFFFGALIITDPVTVTPKPFTGLVSGLILGFIPTFISSSVQYQCGAILIFNVVSFIFNRIPGIADLRIPGRLKIKPPIPWQPVHNEIFNLALNTCKDSVKLPEPQGPSEILSCIRNNKVFGCGGGGFLTSLKIETVLKSEAPEKNFIVNGVECDPGLVHDKIILQKYPDKIFKGISLISCIIPFKRVVLAVKHNVSNITIPENVTLYKTPPFYPAGSERELIKRIVKRTVPSGIPPAKQGILILNVQTILAITEAVVENKTALTKIITVANLKQHQNKAVRVKLGEKVSNIIEKVYPGGFPVFYGGGIMLARQADDDSVIDINTSFIAVSDFVRYKESPQCSHCGLCMRYCPEKLEVNRIADLIDLKIYVYPDKFKPQNCISCGICSYICPAGRNLIVKVKSAAKAVDTSTTISTGIQSDDTTSATNNTRKVLQ
jgi:Na+-translocating ferredoxin:NAD+ oxidoreductase RnfD subunit/ferredoxin